MGAAAATVACSGSKSLACPVLVMQCTRLDRSVMWYAELLSESNSHLFAAACM